MRVLAASAVLECSLEAATCAIAVCDAPPVLALAGAPQHAPGITPTQVHPLDHAETSSPPDPRQVVSGELSDALLDQLSVLSSEVFLPLIVNNNIPGSPAPEVVVKTLTDSMHKFVASGG